MSVRTVGIEVPADFPETAYNDLAEKVAPLQPKYPEAYKRYAGGWNAVAFRFVSAEEYDTEFKKWVQTTSSPTERYRQERSLFGFVMSAVAVLDSAAYALYAVAHMIVPAHFPLVDLHRITFASVAATFDKDFGSERIASVLRAMCDDSEMSQMREIRNVLAHRESTIRAYNSSSATATWDLQRHLLSSGLQKLEIDRTITSKTRNAMSVQLALLANAAVDFARVHF
jgi:hypothetical protein